MMVCIDFTDLNKAYSKDSFSLLRIDQLVDAMHQGIDGKPHRCVLGLESNLDDTRG